MKPFIFFGLPLLLQVSCKEPKIKSPMVSYIAHGQMPNLVSDISGNLHLVYGNGDSLMYAYSNDKGNSFSAPLLISVIPHLAASHSRGPQVAASGNGITVIVCNTMGDIFSFKQDQANKWYQTARINDVDTVAKEGLMALDGDGQNIFAVWLDLRNGHNQVFGARSSDGGKTWSKNMMIYASPDTTVCECCKPSVAVKENNVYVMFRNWLNGNRDMYLIESADGGNHFGEAKKLGNGSWVLNGCPMDGGSLIINKDGNPETVWRRQKKIYASKPGYEEKEIGEGRSCTLESADGKNVYAWIENGEIVVTNSQGIKKSIGKGSSPVLKAISNKQVICVWEREKEIHSAVLEL
jgi:hypothetical protein